jgi:uncharacterized protein
MKYIVNNIRLSLDSNFEMLKSYVARNLRLNVADFKSFRITKESIDARRKGNISIVYSVLIELDGKFNVKSDANIRPVEDEKEEPIIPGSKKMNNRPIIIGCGPAGLFAGLVLAQNGYKPLIIERGEPMEKRTVLVDRYWKTGYLNSEVNVQFGEGGAGTFSDGKLTTRISDRRCEKVLLEFFNAGAPEEILFKAKPHIGSDKLKSVVVNMRKQIIELGGEVRFSTKLTSLKTNNGKVTGITVNDNDEIKADIVVLALGHSARDTFQTLLRDGVKFVQKPFSIGVRIEHPQHIINLGQFGKTASHPRLGAADYQLFYKTGGRTVYSFCMCPGGIVVASASEPDTIVTNGMSEFARDRENANSALVVSVEPGDYGSNHPLAGIEFQRRWERLAFKAGGENNSAPIQMLTDFISGESSKKLGSVKPSYTGSTNLADLNECLPDFVTSHIKGSIGYFDKKLKGFGMGDALLTGVETRTSSPVRIPRSDSLEASGIEGLYPAGEGAGYAGGIVSAAVDGIKIAEQIVKSYALPI